MLKDYEIGPVIFPAVFFDTRFAKKYGINEAIIFNNLAHGIYFTAQQAKYRSYWNDMCGGIVEDGKFWLRCPERYLFGSICPLFDENKIRDILKNLEGQGVFLIRPSLTSGYYWVTFGPEMGCELEER